MESLTAGSHLQFTNHIGQFLFLPLRSEPFHVVGCAIEHGDTAGGVRCPRRLAIVVVLIVADAVAPVLTLVIVDIEVAVAIDRCW